MALDNPNPILGTAYSEVTDGTGDNDTMLGLVGNDTLNGAAGNDVIYGDYADPNLLDGTADATGFSQYSANGSWVVSQLSGGHQQMVQDIATEPGGVYNMSFDLAANFAGGQSGARVEILVDGVVVSSFDTQSGAFSTFDVEFSTENDTAEITIRSADSVGDGPQIDTSGPIYHYEQDMDIGGQTVTVAAFAEGQSNLYQVLNGTLHVFDVETQTYEAAGATGTVNVNSLGYNAEDDLLYAIAVGDGVDSLGNVVSRTDLVMFDAEGNSYRVGETPYRSWTGDFDDQGNLWSFQSSMDRVAVIDVDQFDGDGNPVVTVHQIPPELIDLRFYDVAFNAATQSFYGISRPSAEGEDTVMLVVDISSGVPTFSTIDVTSTVVDGVTLDGVPMITFGAAIMDADGNLFVGGNSGDHDMDNSTATSGGIYQVVIDPVTGEASLHLMADAPRSYSNDGAADPTAENPFFAGDITSSVLIRDIAVVATAEGDLVYDDVLSGNGGADTVSGGIGNDVLIGGSAGDSLLGGSGADTLHGGAGPDAPSNGLVSVYDATGLRYDQFGNLLAADDDFLSGGAGEDTLSGSAGHDTLDGGAANDVLNGGSGSDSLIGGDGDDHLSGGSQDDILAGGAGDDLLEGGSGDDALDGGAGVDVLHGGSGDDVLQGGGDADLLEGSSGHDNLSGDTGADTLRGGSGDDTLEGGAGADELHGGSGDDVLDGDDGADVMRGGTGNDVMSGGSGKDRLNGGSGNDVLNGGDGNDYLAGYTGDDTLDGGAGNDRLVMGAGADEATGGLGADRFIFNSGSLDAAMDVITDFSITEGDQLLLQGLNLGAGGMDLITWFDANATVQGDDVHLALGNNTTLVLIDTAEDADLLYHSFVF